MTPARHIAALAAARRRERVFCLENALARRYLRAGEAADILDYVRAAPTYRPDQPFPVVVAWGTEGAVTVTAGTDAALTENVRSVSAEGTSARLWNLLPGRTYHYRVTGTGIDVSGRFRTEGGLRMIRLDSVNNVRDLGGWPGAEGTRLRYGLLYRGGTLDGISEEDAAVLRDELGVRCELDLRADGETDAQSSALGPEVDYVRLPLGSYGEIAGEDIRAGYKRALDVVLARVGAGEPVYVHCASGADRTGTLAYLLGGVLGVSEADLVRDYELTSFSHEGLFRSRADERFSQLSAYVNSRAGESSRDRAESWFREAGFTPAELEAFRAAMLIRE